MSQFIVDNRQLPYQDFHIDASYASYQRNVSSLIGKYCTLSNVYSWLQHPAHIVFALSPDKVRLVHKSQWNVGQISALLEPRYACVGSALIAKSTWGTYFVDAVNKLLESFQKLPRLEKESTNSWTWYLLSTDLCLLGDHRSTGLEEGLTLFCRACKAAHGQIPRLKIRIICTIISDQTGSIHFDNPHMVTVHSKLNTLNDFVSFHSVMNSALHFDEELRCMVSQCAPQLCTKLDFPALFGAHCSLVLQLSASTGTAGNAMHAGLQQLQLCSLVPRAQVDPVLIDGKALHVTCPALVDAQDFLTSERSHHENQLTFRGVARWLAQHDILLIVRVPCALPNSSLVNDQYWALVPPAAASTSTSNSTFLSSTSPAASDAYPKVTPALRRNTSEAVSAVRGASPWDYMQLLKLVDSDDLLVPRVGRVHNRTPSSASTAPSTLLSVEASSVLAQVTPLNSARSDSQEPPLEGARQEETVQESAQTAQQEQDKLADEDEMMMQDVSDYLDASLESSLGAPDRYNPMLCASGTINNMFEIQCKAQSSSHSRAPAVSFTETVPPVAASNAGPQERRRSSYQSRDVPSAPDSTAPVAATSAGQKGLTLHAKPATSTASASTAGTSSTLNQAITAAVPAKKGTTVSAPVPSVPSVPSAPVGRGRKPTAASGPAASVAPAGGAPGRGRGGGAGRGAGAGTSSAGSKKRLIASSWTDAIAMDLTSDTEENPGSDLMRPRSRKTSAFTTLTSIDDEPSSAEPTEPTSHQLALTTRNGGGGSNKGAHARTPARPQQQQQQQQQQPLTVPRTNTVAPVAAHSYTHQQAAQSEPEEETFVPRFFKRKFGARPVPVAAAHPAAAWHDDEEEEADV